MTSKTPRPTYHHGNLVQALVRAAIDIIDERGLDRVTVREAARRAGVSSGAPFRHFKSKSSLMLAIAEHAMGLLMAAFTQAEEASASLRGLQKVEAFGHAYIDWAFDNPTHLQILWTRFIVDASQSELVVQQSDISLRMWSQLFKDAKLQGDLAADADEELIAFSTRCHLFGLVRMWTDGDFYAEELKSNPRSAMKRAFSLHVASLAVTSND